MTEDTIIKALTHYKVWMENMAGVYFTAGDLTGATDCVQAARDADKILSAWQSERSFAETLAKVQEMDRMLKGNNITESLAKAQAMRDELAGWDAIVPTTDCAYCNSTGKCDDDNECGFCDNSLTTRMDTK